MSNTVIQIKRSTSTAVPATLNAAEPAYSYVSNKLFLGDSSGSGVIAVGGKFYVDQQNTIFDVANAAFSKANTGDALAIAAAFDTANIAIANVNYANAAVKAAYDFANTVYSNYAYPAYVAVGPAFDKANAANSLAYSSGLIASAGFNAANGAFGKANSASDAASAGYTKANTAYDAAAAGFGAANGAFLNSNSAYSAANAAFDKANSASTIASAAYDNANTKLSTSGGTITGDLSIIGTLNLSGNTVFANVETLRISDPLLYLAGNNYSSDIVDIGFVANYNNGSANLHTGFFRDSTTKEYYVFQNYNQEPENNHIDPTANGFTLAVLNADIRTSNLVLGGQNTINWITAAYATANSSTVNGGAAFDAANGAFTKANTADTTAIAAYNQANTATAIGSAAFNNSNSAFSAASAAYNQANTGTTIASAAYNKANTADTNAANASYLSVGTVPSSVVSGSYTGITGVGTITTGTWNGSTIDVSHGGTGATSFTTNGIVYGNGTGALGVTAAGTEGQVLQASATGVPQFGMLDGGSF